MDIIAISCIKIPAQGLLQRPCYRCNMFYIQILSVQTVQKTNKNDYFFNFPHILENISWTTFSWWDFSKYSTVTYNGRRLKVEDKEIAVYCLTMIVDK